MLQVMVLDMLVLMKQVLIELDDELAAKLERAAPARSRRRSEFIRTAIKQALCALEEEATRGAYQRIPDDLSDYAFDPRTWEPWTAGAGAGSVAEGAGEESRPARRRSGTARQAKRRAR